MAKKVGIIIRELRLKAALTQEQFAERVGISWPYIGQIERGDRAPSIKTLEKIAKGLDVTPDIFFNEDSILIEIGHLPKELLEFSKDKKKRKLLSEINRLSDDQVIFLENLLPLIKHIKKMD